MSSNVYALSTARAGSKSVKDKNIMDIQGKPLYLHNLLESMATPEIKDTFISTNIDFAIENADKYGYKVIRRPEELCQDASTHTDTIYHGLKEIEKITNNTVDILVVMLGNTMNMDAQVVKEALAMLANDQTIDSVVTVIRANHFNPMRAYVDDGSKSNTLTTYLHQEQIAQITSKKDISDKNSAGNILFQNGLWIIRRRAIIRSIENKEGMLPFPWFGNNVKYIEQDPRLQEIDDAYQVRLLC